MKQLPAPSRRCTPAPVVCRQAALALLLACSLWSRSALAQERDTLEAALPEVRIEATRFTESEASAPFGVAVVGRGPEQVALEPGLSLDDVLNELPGIWTSDRGHFASGERIVIRGMGWRSGFGVRGVAVLLDGVPLTMPDGQAVADIVDPALIRRAELIRGPASLFWGNAAGGVLSLSTEPGPGEPTARARALAGSYGVRHLSAEASASPGRHRVHGFVSDQRQEGFRSYSEGRFSRAVLTSSLDLGSRTRLKLMGAAASQDAANPGSLDSAQVAADRRMANARNVATRAGKESTQVQGGATLLRETGLGLLTATGSGVLRDLANPLSFAYIDVYRRAGGLRLGLEQSAGRLEWRAGADAALMSDDRREHSNVAGVRDTLALDQQERVLNVAASAGATLHLTGSLSASAGLRADRIRFEAEDRLLVNADQSGARTFSAWSPSLGLAYRYGSGLAFANVSTAFETPTTTELVNEPGSEFALDPDLEPQRTVGGEVGVRGAVASARLRYDAAFYAMRTTNGIVAEQVGDRDVFLNTGRNAHRGAELLVEWQPVGWTTLQVSYTGTDLTFREGEFEGNRLPGVPLHRLFGSAELRSRGLRARLSAETASRYPVDSANLHYNPGFTVLDASLGYTGLRLGSAAVLPFVRVGNLLDEEYNNSVVINATGRRFYEPAPGRTLQAGFNVSL